MAKKSESTTYVLNTPGQSIFVTGQGGTLIRVDFVKRGEASEVIIRVGAEPAVVRK